MYSDEKLEIVSTADWEPPAAEQKEEKAQPDRTLSQMCDGEGRRGEQPYHRHPDNEVDLRQLFRPGMIRPRVGDRVMHLNTRERGTVQGTATVGCSPKVVVLTVAYDNGRTASMVPENEFIKTGGPR